MPDQKPAGCLFVLLKLLGLAPPLGEEASEQLPYRTRDDFLSAAEISFYHVLRQALDDQFAICPKVRIADILFVKNRRDNLAYANRIDRKHVDFLLCDPATMQPRLAVELDDASHQRLDREERDDIVDAAFLAADLPLVRFPARRQYNPSEVETEIAAAAGQRSRIMPQANAIPENGPPACPKCDATMVVRQAKRGTRQGQRFYACPNYPQCKSTLPLEG